MADYPPIDDESGDYDEGSASVMSEGAEEEEVVNATGGYRPIHDNYYSTATHGYGDGSSGIIEIAFSFDTTGSMSSVRHLVRQKVGRLSLP